MIENPFDGGGGYTPQEVARMTPDQVYLRLADIKVIKAKANRKQVKVAPEEIDSFEDEEGYMKVRTEDGKLVKMKRNIGGKSLARTLMDEAEAKGKAANKKRRRKRKQS